MFHLFSMYVINVSSLCDVGERGAWDAMRVGAGVRVASRRTPRSRCSGASRPEKKTLNELKQESQPHPLITYKQMWKLKQTKYNYHTTLYFVFSF
jgi:hypothetical protein